MQTKAKFRYVVTDGETIISKAFSSKKEADAHFKAATLDGKPVAECGFRVERREYLGVRYI